MTLKATNYRQLMVAGLCLLAVGCSSDDDDDDAAPQVVLSGDAAFSM